MAGRPKKYSKKALRDAIEKYFGSISRTVAARDDKGREIYNDDGEKITRTEYITPPGISALCLYLGIDRSTWQNYCDARQHPELSDITAQARARMEAYASTAAAQAGNYYAAQMTDKIPELYQLAYNKYLNDYNMKLSDLGAVQGAEQNDYDKYLNQLNQYNTDRSFNYAVLLDEINSQKQEREEALNKALTAAEFGDYSFLQDMGINTDNNPTEWEKQYTLALLAAEYGDYSGLQALGINPGAGSGTGSLTGTSGGADSLAAGLGVSTDAVMALENALSDYPNGIVTDRETWDYLKSNFGEATLESRGLRFMGTGTTAGATSGAELTANAAANLAAMEGTGLTEQDWAQIAGLGIGAASASLVNELLNRGAVIETSTGTLTWAPGWNATNYKQRLAAPGNAFAGSIHA